jgi:hypothetical protein
MTTADISKNLADLIRIIKTDNVVYVKFGNLQLATVHKTANDRWQLFGGNIGPSSSGAFESLEDALKIVVEWYSIP